MAEEKKGNVEVAAQPVAEFNGSLTSDHTHRKLKLRHVELMAFGGTIGTALFVQMGSTLPRGGPGSLFLAFTIWSTFILAVNNCHSEMVSWIPISSPFVRFADRFVDPALGFCAGINFFVLEAASVPFEVVAFNLVLQFWTDRIPTVAVVFFVLVCYAALNVFAVRYYGESEFWLALGKLLLAIGLMMFTFVTMVGGNPLHDAYGFRNWNPSRVPGTPFAEYIRTGDLGRFLGFLACLIQASFTVGGPEYVSMAAGEAQVPRKTMPRAYKTVYPRLAGFFILGSLCMGVVVPYNDPDLADALSNARPGAGASPYTIAMQNMNIPVLPHVFNAVLLTSIFSAGNSYVFCASRTLFGLALEGKAPKILGKCTKSGVPVYCTAVTIAIALLSFLQVSNNSAVVLSWLVNLVTASLLLNHAIVSFTYIRFHKAMRVQGISRNSLPHRSFWQPFSAYYALCGTIVMAFVGGYEVFLPGRWNIPSFFFSYTMIGLVPLLFVGWKLIHRTKWRRLEDIDFFDVDRAKIDQYEHSYVEVPPKTLLERTWMRLF